jgi:hypothetical protein
MKKIMKKTTKMKKIMKNTKKVSKPKKKKMPEVYCEVEEIWAYACPKCDEIYEEEYEAAECCSISEVVAFKCLVCDTLFREQEDAENCCLKCSKCKELLMDCGCEK